MSKPENAGIAGLVVGRCDTKLWGISGSERARRVLQKVGAGHIVEDPAEARRAGSVVMVRADWVVETALIDLLAKSPDTVLFTRRGTELIAVAGHVRANAVGALFAALSPDAAADAEPLPKQIERVVHDDAAGEIYLPRLRKRLKPVVMELAAKTVAAAEKATFAGSYKSVTDAITKYVWPAPARVVTRWCAKAAITPNQVTLAGLAMVFFAPYAFLKGWFWVGLAAGWLMTFLDTVDGKLARCTLTYTKFGDVLDHGIDLVSPPFWWLAWHFGCLATGANYPFSTATIWAVFAGYIIVRLQEGFFIRKFGMHIHVWRRFDSFFRLIVARRNPVLVILTVAMLFGKPGWGLMVTGAWTLTAIGVHLVQTAQALAARRKGPVVSWMAQ